MYRVLLLFSLFFWVISESNPAAAQQRPGSSGVLHVTNWPGGSRDFERNKSRYDIAASIDTLSLGYAFRVVDDAPVLSMAVEWKPGSFGILDGREVPFDQIQDTVFVTAAALLADVQVDGRKVAEISFRIDGLRLSPYPAIHHVDAQALEWAGLFEKTAASDARAYFSEGFELVNPRLAAVAFESEAAGETYATRQPRTSRRSSRRASTVIVEPAVHILVDLAWLFRRPVYDVDYPDAPERPREGRMGRDRRDDDRPPRNTEGRGTRRDTEEGETEPIAEEGTSRGHDRTPSADADNTRTSQGRGSKASSGKSDSEDEDDDDDKKELLPAALTAAAAVGVLAYAGGTVGYFGNTEHAPIGLSAGMVRRNGGILLQAGINEAVLDGSGPEHLLAKVVGFYAVVPGPVQPAVGAGILVTRANSETTYEPSLSLGLAGNFGPVVLLGAYDVALNGFEVGVSFNFRSRR